jgi:precorrin-6B methylase 2
MLQHWVENGPAEVHKIPSFQGGTCIGPSRAEMRKKMIRYLCRAFLPIVAICLAYGQTEEQYRQLVGHIQTALALKSGAVVADIGTGESPEQPLHIAKAVGSSGKVICIDIDEKVLAKLQAKFKEDGLTNVETRLGRPDDPMLAAHSVDAVLIAFAYHHFEEPSAMLAHIRAALRPEGRLVVIEAISEKNQGLSRERQIKDHELSPEVLGRELAAAGFEVQNGAETLVEGDGVRRYLFSAHPPK